MPGEMTYTCTRCNDSYKEEIAPLRHSWGETKPGQAPTCTAAGYTSYETCTRCGYSNRDIIPAAGHQGGTATCQAQAVCEVCHEPYGDFGDHSYSETYATDGNDHWKVCTVCQAEGTKENHQWDTEGYCSVCNMTNNKFFSFTEVTGGYSIEFISTLKNDSALFNELCELEQIVLPQEYNDQPIVEIAQDGFNCHSGGLNKLSSFRALPDGKLISITIPDTVTTIKANAFTGFATLKTVEISENSQLTAINGNAFSLCDDLASFYIPKDLNTMNDGVFNNCYALSTITVHPENQKYYVEGNCLINKTAMTLEVGTANSEIPEGVTTIRNQAFMGRKNLKSIKIPASLTTISANAFQGCENLSSVTFAENSQLTTIGGGTFSNCYALTSITIPANVTKIGDSAFSGCFTLKSVAFEDTTGWIVNDKEKDVSNPSSNAKYFTNYSTYYYPWTKQTD